MKVVSMEQISLKDWLIRIFFIFLSFFMMNRLFFFSPGVAEITSSYLLYPCMKIQMFLTAPIRNFFLQQSNVQDLHTRIDDLVDQNDTLRAEVIALRTTIDFENRSQEARSFEKKYDVADKKLVQIMMKSFDDLGHICWIDAGLQHGVQLNMIAVYKNNIVGRVIHVDALHSKVAFITDKRCKVAISCAQTKTVGVYQGNNSFRSTLEFVPHYEKLMVGDMLISTGQGLVYPQGFAIGSIIDFNVHDVAYHVTIQPLINLEQLDYFYLIAA